MHPKARISTRRSRCGKRSRPTRCEYDRVVEMTIDSMRPSYWAPPGMVTDIDGKVPDLRNLRSNQRRTTELALEYMGLKPTRRSRTSL